MRIDTVRVKVRVRLVRKWKEDTILIVKSVRNQAESQPQC
jgi:hypothetical protein